MNKQHKKAILKIFDDYNKNQGINKPMICFQWQVIPFAIKQNA